MKMLTCRQILGARRRASGISLIEALVSLAITAALLTAVGVAYTAAADAIRNNDEFFRAQQAARVSINHALTSVRQCNDNPVITSTSLVVTVPTADHSVETRTYQYDSTAKTLTLTTTYGVTTESGVIARNVTSCSFSTDAAQEQVCMKINVQVGENQILLSGSALPRIMINYN